MSQPVAKEKKKCDTCDKNGANLMQCGACKAVRYCDSTCMTGWAGHKAVCKQAQHNALRCSAVQTSLHRSAMYCTPLQFTALRRSVIHCVHSLWCTALRCVTMHCVALLRIPMRCAALHCTVLQCSVVHCAVPLCIALCCNALY
jgi:hypothetical protein